MAKVGDTVRYLNDVGGGVITKIDGKIAYVDDAGFETPMLIKDLVVVLPAGYESTVSANLMFDQKAVDMGKLQPVEDVVKQVSPSLAMEDNQRIEETSHGDKLNIVLAFEPADSRQLSKTTFNAVLVNDSNYFLSFTFLTRADGERGWNIGYQGDVAPNELIDLCQYTHETIGEIDRIALQCIAYKKGRTFEMKPPVNAVRRLDLTKFHKLHCFRKSVYFDTPVLEFPLVRDDEGVRNPETDVERIRQAGEKEKVDKKFASELSKKYRIDESRGKNKKSDSDNPHKLLPLIEVDLHIGELLDTTRGMDESAMLETQLAEVRKVMNSHHRRIGQKIVFIHGKGDGVLRKRVLELLRKEFPKAETQDASFREYGFGATLVTVH